MKETRHSSHKGKETRNETISVLSLRRWTGCTSLVGHYSWRRGSTYDKFPTSVSLQRSERLGGSKVLSQYDVREVPSSCHNVFKDGKEVPRLQAVQDLRSLGKRFRA